VPNREPIVGIPGFEAFEITGTKQVVTTTCSLNDEPACPGCKSHGPHRRKDLIKRRIRHTSIGARAHWLVVHVPKWRCRCGRYFRQRVPGVLPHQRATEQFKEEVVERHEHGHSLSRIEQSHHLSWATTERWVHQRYAHRVSHQASRVAPKVLGIDEHFFTRKDGFATTFANLETHRVFDVQLGRSALSLQRFLDELPGKEHTEVVCMDLSETYRAIVKRHFANAIIVADRFHVIRLVTQYLMEAWKQLEPVGRKHRGLISLMRRKPENLDPEQRLRLEAYFTEHPLVGAVYDQLQRLMQLLRNKHQKAKQCRWHIRHYLRIVSELREAPMLVLHSLAATLWSWRDEIARMWRFTKSNAITEGLHNKMEVISRRAYGFRNFQNYRLRVRALCG
jgi:transposase